MISKLAIAALLVLSALPFVPAADACVNNCQPPVGVCVDGVNSQGCTGGHDVCVYGATWAPTCRDVPCGGDLSCIDLPAPCDGKYFQCTCDICDFSANPELGPLVGACVDGVTSDGCYDDAWICVGMSYQIPFCVDHQTITCTEVCNPCMTISCDVPQVPNPCETPWLKCDPAPITINDPCDWLVTCTIQPPIASSGPAFGPLVSACVKGVTDDAGCSGGHDVCVYGFSWVPQCADVPPASCGEPVCGWSPDPVKVCTGHDACAGGHTFCVVVDTSNPYVLTANPRPICGDCACMPLSGPSAGPSIGPLLAICVKGVSSADGCSGGHDVCLYGFTWVPQCADVPISISDPPCHNAKECAQLVGEQVPLAVCVHENGCWGGHDVCVYGFSWVPQCVDLPPTD